MNDDADLPAGQDVRGDLVCTQCARVAGTAQGQSIRYIKKVTLRVQDPRHADAVRRLCCPHCSGRLWLQNNEEVRVDPLLFQRQALPPTRGRLPKTPRLS